MSAGISRVPRMLFVLAAVLPLLAAAADKRMKYVPPAGFANHQWGELRTTFKRLPDEPLGVGAAFTLPHEKRSTFHCVPAVARGPVSGAMEGCDFQATLLRIRKEYEGGGFYVLSEYAIPDQGFRMGDEQTGVMLHPVVYQFCANWHGSLRKKEEPKDFDELNKLCGVRLMFESESRADLEKLPSDHVTAYDRMLELLIAKFGRPAGFARRGQVVIETEEGETTSAAARKFSIWRWCPAPDRGFHTECEASVVLTINPATGQGAVLYSTPLLWEYAFARQNNGFKGDWLFRVLHARK